MQTQYDANLIQQFLAHTPESALKKMLSSPQFTSVHFQFLMKIVRNCNEDQFCEHFYNSTFPKIKLNAAEINLKETFWTTLTQVLNSHGLLSPASKIAA